MATTAQQVLIDVRNRTNTVNNTDVNDSVLLTWLDQSMRNLYDLIIEKNMFGVSYAEFTVTGSSTVTAKGDIGFLLPADFYRLKAIDLVVGGDSFQNLPRIPDSQRNTAFLPLLQQLPTSAGVNVNQVGYLPEALVPGGAVLLLPKASAQGQYWLRYYPQLPIIATTAATILPVFDQSGWWEWASLDVCEKLMNRHDRDPSPFAARKLEIGERIERAAATMDVGQGQKLDPARGRQRSGFPWSTMGSW